MSLLQISDPSKDNNQQKKFVVGIDLGTTNSLIVSYDDDFKIYEDNKSKLIPSVVSIDESGKTIVGASAVNYLDNENATHITSIKRIMGLSFDDMHDINYKNDSHLNMLFTWTVNSAIV